MTQQLIYTSAPRGLRAGNQGFCTVAATEGMSTLLMERLESLSMYPRDAAAVAAVVHSHFRINLGGKVLHVLSRVQRVEAEYTGRTNHLAQHLALEPHELPLGGPAWLLSQSGLWLSSWEGEPRWLPSGKGVPTGGPAAGPCRRWQKVMGDAGWAGVLLDALLQSPDVPAYVMFDQGQEVLPLFEEAVGLLPLEQRWGVTFTTFFYPQLGPEAPCLLRGVLRGSAGGKRLRATGLVLHLGQPEGEPAPSPWVVAARTGQCPSAMAGAGLPASKHPVLQPPMAIAGSGLPGNSVPSAIVHGATPRGRRRADRSQTSSRLDAEQQHEWDAEQKPASRGRIRVLLGFAAGFALAALLMGGALAIYHEWEPTQAGENEQKLRSDQGVLEKDNKNLQDKLGEAARREHDLKLAKAKMASDQGVLEKKCKNLQDELGEVARRERDLNEKLAKARMANDQLTEQLEKAKPENQASTRKDATELMNVNLPDPKEKEKPVVLKDLKLAKGEPPKMRIRGAAEPSFSWEVQKKGEIKAFPLPTGKESIGRHPICSIKHSSKKQGKDVSELITFSWEQPGQYGKKLLADLRRSVLEVKGSNTIYVHFWQGNLWQYPAGLPSKQIHHELDVAKDKKGNDTVSAKFYMLIDEVRVPLWTQRWYEKP